MHLSLPLHSLPSPKNPSKHVQIKVPSSTSLQVAYSWQPFEPAFPHRSKSIERCAKLIYLYNCSMALIKGPVIIYGWGWAQRENISKQKNIFTQPFTKQKYLQLNRRNAGGGKSTPP